MMVAAPNTHRTCEERNRTWKRQERGEGRVVGTEGLVAWGGTLAIAGLMAVFTFGTTAMRRKRGSGSIAREESRIVASNEAEEEHSIERKKGLSLVLLGDCKCCSVPAEGCHDQCCCCIHTGGSKKGAAYVDSCASISSGTSIPVRKEDLASVKGREESQIQLQDILLLSDDSQPGSIASGDDYSCFAEELHLPTEGKADIEGSLVHSDEEECSEEEDSTVEAYNTDEAEGSSEEAEDTEEDSDYEAVWPVESIDEALVVFAKLSNTDSRMSNMIRERYITGHEGKMLGMEVLIEEALLKAAHLPKSGNWIFFVGIALLLLLPLLL